MNLCKSLVALGVVTLTSGTASANDNSAAIWRNPSDSVHIRAEPCGSGLCGVVVWASEKAKTDARKGSTQPLEGARLFRDFVEEKPGVWRGRVFVPDIGRTFTGRITKLDPNRLEAKGCLAGRIGCRTQIWTRITD